MIFGAFFGWFFERRNIIFQEYRNVVIEFRDVLVGIFNSINGLDFDKHFEASKFVVNNFSITDLLFNKLVLTTRCHRRKRKITEVYEKYKNPYQMSQEQAYQFSEFNHDKDKKYKPHYRPKDIPDGINIAKNNIEYLIYVVNYHNIFSFFKDFKK